MPVILYALFVFLLVVFGTISMGGYEEWFDFIDEVRDRRKK